MTKQDATQVLVTTMSADIFMLEARMESIAELIAKESNPGFIAHLSLLAEIDRGTLERLKAQQKSIVDNQS